MSKKRLYYFDNAKFILISLVLVGHFFEPILEQDALARSLYILIYTFHMPAFIFIAGYFTKLNSDFRFYLIKNIRKLIIPYFIFQLLYLIFNSVLNYSNFPFTFKKPFWILWFLLSLFFWRLILYLLNKSKIPPAAILAAALVISLLAGFFDTFGRFYSTSRTAVFFPFFMLGYYFKSYNTASRLKQKFKLLRQRSVLLIYALELLIIYIFLKDLNLEILYGAVSYAELGLSPLKALFNRAFFLSTAVINLFLFFTAVPFQRTLISSRGARSLYPYLLHGFIVIFLDKFDFFDFLSPGLNFIIYLLLGLFFSWLLSGRKSRDIFKYILEF
ncbi:MAG: acyltransferase family protein [Halanaerobium sp.]